MIGRSLHEQVAETRLRDVLADKDAAVVLSDWINWYRDGKYNRDEFDVYGQTHALVGGWPLEQLCAAVAIHAGRNSGRYAWSVIPVGAPPGPDKKREQNQALLDAAISGDSRAHVDLHQNLADQDGYLSWTTRKRFERSTGVPFIDEKHGYSPVTAIHYAAPRQVPLEIGYTMPSRTLAHLEQDRGVARWPYESKYVTVLLDCEPIQMGL